MKRSGPWSDGRTLSFLEGARFPLRIACLGSDDYPLIASLWFHPVPTPDGLELWCATQSDAHIARLLEANERCAFEVAGDQPPYMGVRGRARARLDHSDGATVLARLIDRYLGDSRPGFARWLLERSHSEVAIALEVVRLTSWDYSQRMTA